MDLRGDAVGRYDALRDAMDGHWQRVDTVNFYSAVFPDGSLDREWAWATKAGETEREHGRAIMLQLNAGAPDTSIHVRTDPSVRRHFVYDHLDGLVLPLFRPGVFVMAPIAYWGSGKRDLRFAHTLRALAIDLDEPVLDSEGRPAVLGHCGRGSLPMPTFTVVSGTGVHLYYVLDEPLDMTPALQRAANALKHAMVDQLWTPATSNLADAQFEGIDQAFRVVGSHANLDEPDGHTGPARNVTAWKTGSTTSVRALTDAIDDPARREHVAKLFAPRMPWEQAKEKYPEWAERVEQRAKPQAWPIKRDLYEWWKRQAEHAVEGHRYHYLMALAIYGRKCAVPAYEVRADMMELLPILGAKGVAMSEIDVDDAMDAYDDKYLAWSRQAIEELTGIRIQPRKRNGRTRAEHLAWARSIQAEQDPEGSWRGHGKPSKEREVTEWIQAHPEATQAECAKALGVAPSTVHKYWKGGKRVTKKGRQICEYLAAHPDASITQIAHATGISRPTIIRYRNAFNE